MVACEEAINRNPHDLLLYQYKIIILEQLKRPQEALDTYEQVIRLEPHSADHYESKGDLLLELGRPQEALQAYKQATTLRPDTVEYYDKQGKILLGFKRYEEAVVAYEHALNLNSESVLYHQNKGSALLALKRYQEAFADYEACIQLGTNDPYCYFAQGQALFGLEHYEEALAIYKQSQVLGSPLPDPRFYHEQAVVYERLAQCAYEEEKQAKEQVMQAQQNGQYYAAGGSLSTIPGIEPEIQSKLEAQGIRTRQQLIEQTRTKEERSELAQIAEISTHMLGMLSDRAEFLQLQGVTPFVAVMLEEAGVNGNRDLRRRNPEHL